MIEVKDLIGTWHLESWTIAYSDRDELSNPFGEDPQGLLLYSAEGWMSASICHAERPRFPAEQSPRRVDDGPKAEAFSSYFHYAGRYKLSGGDVIHYVTQSLNPNFPGTEQLRHAELDGQTLVLSGKDEVAGVTRFHVLVWHRAEALELDSAD
ncbi:lipocalin-like domain-containing protein [Parahaliea sp. F7430]|uniref:Lipocalin-like domain-containing protein n=1 Tax=Sediminihaliea albiluteola TaxID=2758564 RepID=A0A7W2TTI0_9GAMM|nr:lipocalin-like domain-containing protein [Sediminihaliea albiluteola]MBA6411647.1 lipocalin-like domain-containing protein [Sediminihaliea albiluteola]